MDERRIQHYFRPDRNMPAHEGAEQARHEPTQESRDHAYVPRRRVVSHIDLSLLCPHSLKLISVTVVSMLRLKWMIQFANTQNVTWDYTPVGYWSTLEVHIGIVIACLPALRSLQHRIFPSTKTPTSYYNRPSGAYGYNSKGGSPFPSISKFRKQHSNLTTSASQASMMRSRDRTKKDKDFIQLDEYEIRLDSDVEKGEVRRGINNTQIERGSVHREDAAATFIDSSSLATLPQAGAYNAGRPYPQDVITVRKEYSVNVEYNSDSLSPSPPRLSEERILPAKESRTSILRKN